MSLFTFHNEFDDVDVVLDDESERVDVHGPFSVKLVAGDRAVGAENFSETYASLADARTKFLELVGNEIDAVLSQG